MDDRQQHPTRAPAWPWSAMARAQAAPAASVGGQASTPAEWVARCTVRLAQLVTDEGVARGDLEALALDLVEEARFRELGPEAAAELHAREHA